MILNNQSMSKYFITFLIILNSFFVAGQQNVDSLKRIELTTIAQVNQGNSYITFPTDIGNIEPLWFEGNLTPSFYIRESKDSKLMGVVTTQVIIRMYREESYPVRTPSYIPQLTAYYSLDSNNKNNSLTLFGKLAHHSNGQEGDFFLENGDINIKTGNFSTNYYELGLIKTNFNKKYKATQFFASSIEIHPRNMSLEEMYASYSLYRLNTIFSIFKIPNNQSKIKNANISLKGKAVWMFGDMNSISSLSLNRLNLSLTFYYHPKFLEDIGFFAQLYHGMDYYNIYFNHQLNIIRFGIMTEKLRF